MPYHQVLYLKAENILSALLEEIFCNKHKVTHPQFPMAINYLFSPATTDEFVTTLKWVAGVFGMEALVCFYMPCYVKTLYK